MRIIPAIDIIEGKCVRLEQGNYASKKVYAKNPLDIAKEFEDYGIQYLHLVDLDGAKANRIINWKVLYKIASKTNLKIDFGGGLKSDENLRIAFESGAQQITAGSIAVKNRSIVVEWIKNYGSEKIILGADVKSEKVAISGWKEQTEIDIYEFIDGYQKEGIKYVVSTDISKDGMLNGTSNELYKNISDRFPEIKLIASGGVSSVKDLDLLQEFKVDGAIIGKAIYENRITLKELQNYAN